MTSRTESNVTAASIEKAATTGESSLLPRPAPRWFLGLEQTLVRELRQADAVIGVGKVLPFGRQPAEKVEPLPPIARGDVRLIAWMAVEGTRES